MRGFYVLFALLCLFIFIMIPRPKEARAAIVCCCTSVLRFITAAIAKKFVLLFLGKKEIQGLWHFPGV